MLETSDRSDRGSNARVRERVRHALDMRYAAPRGHALRRPQNSAVATGPSRSPWAAVTTRLVTRSAMAGSPGPFQMSRSQRWSPIWPDASRRSRRSPFRRRNTASSPGPRDGARFDREENEYCHTRSRPEVGAQLRRIEQAGFGSREAKLGSFHDILATPVDPERRPRLSSRRALVQRPVRWSSIGEDLAGPGAPRAPVRPVTWSRRLSRTPRSVRRQAPPPVARPPRGSRVGRR